MKKWLEKLKHVTNLLSFINDTEDVIINSVVPDLIYVLIKFVRLYLSQPKSEITVKYLDDT